MQLRPFLLALMLGGCGGPDIDSLVGDYRRSHRVFVFHGNEPVEVDAQDRLDLRKDSDNGLRFSLHTTSAGGDNCSAQGSARPRGKFFEYRPATAGDCVLRILPGDTEVVVEDVAGACQPHFCDKRASIGRLGFPRP